MTFREAKQYLDPQNAVQIGKILKPHGYKGHVTIHLKFEPTELEEESVLVRINGWLIPFFIDYDESNLEALKPILKLQEVNDEDFARSLAHKPLFLPRHLAEKYLDLTALDNLIGYEITDKTSGKTGIITEYEEVPKNPLIKVIIGNQEYLIPVNAAQVVELDDKKRTVKVVLPEGLL